MAYNHVLQRGIFEVGVTDLLDLYFNTTTMIGSMLLFVHEIKLAHMANIYSRYLFAYPANAKYATDAQTLPNPNALRSHNTAVTPKLQLMSIRHAKLRLLDPVRLQIRLHLHLRTRPLTHILTISTQRIISSAGLRIKRSLPARPLEQPLPPITTTRPKRIRTI